MDAFLQWIGDNREWLFSGGGLIFITYVARKIFPGSKKYAAPEPATVQHTEGTQSPAITAKGDVNITYDSNPDGD